MKIKQLEHLIHVPCEMKNALCGEDFPVCWYGCAGLDFRLVNEVFRLEPILGIRPRVFIYTDIGYISPGLDYFRNLDNRIMHWHTLHGWGEISYPELGEARMKDIVFQSLRGESENARVLWVNYNGFQNPAEQYFIVLIHTTNQVFEKSSIAFGLEFEIVCEAGGMSGSQRPLRLGDLGARWSFGYLPRFIGEDFLYNRSSNEYESSPSWTRIPFYSEHVLDTDWGANGVSGYPLRKIFYLDINDFHSDDHASAEAVRLGYNQSEQRRVDLDHLTELDIHAAKILAPLNVDLSLGGLNSISDEVATILGRHSGTLSLNALSFLSNKAAAALANHKGNLHLDGLKDLTPQAAKFLSAIQGNLCFGNLQRLLAPTAEALSHHNQTLYLNSIQSLDPDSAKALAMHKGPIKLTKINYLSKHIANFLAPRNDVSFGEIERLSQYAAQQLVERNNVIYLNKIKILQFDVAEALSKNKGSLHLDGLETLSAECAQALSTHAGKLSLNGLKEIDPHLEPLLFSHKGVLLLNGAERVCGEISKKLFHPASGYFYTRSTHNAWPWDKLGIEFQCILLNSHHPVLFLNGKKLSKKVAEILIQASTNHPKILIKKCKGITNNAITILSKFKGELVFDGKSLDDSPGLISTLLGLPIKLSFGDFNWGVLNPDRARLLSKISPPGRLDLKTVSSISFEAFCILAKHPGGFQNNPEIKIHCPNFEPFLKDIDKAKLVASFPRRAELLQRMIFGQVSGLSLDCARILSKTKSPLHLDSLKNTDPEVLEVLSQHRGTLSLSGMANLDEQEAMILAKHRGPLVLNGIQSFDLKSLTALSKHIGMLFFDGVQSISDPEAEKIAQIPCPVSLRGIKEVGENARKILSKKIGYCVRFNKHLWNEKTKAQNRNIAFV